MILCAAVTDTTIYRICCNTLFMCILYTKNRAQQVPQFALNAYFADIKLIILGHTFGFKLDF